MKLRAVSYLRSAALAAAIALCASSVAQERVTLSFSNAEIEAVVRAIGQLTGKTFVVDPRVRGTLSLVIEQPLSAEQALAALSTALRFQGIALVDAGGVVRVVPEADAKLQGGPVQTAPAARGDQLVTQVFRLNSSPAANIVQVLRPLIAPNNTISAYPTTNTIVVTDYAENVRRIARIIQAIDAPEGSEVEIVRLEHAIASDLAVLLGRMLDAAAQTMDATQRVTVLAEPTSNSLVVRSSSPARVNLVRTLIAKLDQPSQTPGNIHVVYLKNAEATRLARTLLGITGAETSTGLTPAATPATFQARPPGAQALSQPAAAVSAAAAAPATAQTPTVSGQFAGAQIHADPATNTIIVTAPEAVYRQVRGVIDKLDVRRAQVFIESLIVEVSGDQAAEFGIQWQTGLQHGTSGATAGALGGTNFGGAGQNILGIAQNPASVGPGFNIGIARGQINLPGVGAITNLQFLARALESQQQANILSTPNLLTLDNEEARIIVGQNVPFITGQFVSTAGAATVNPFQTIERRDVGLTLRVRPQISEGGTIRLVIYQEVSSVQSATAAGPVTSMRAIETNVLVDNGSIVVLGGLIQDNVTTTQEKVPLLGDIPILGHLFRYETRKQQKTNLMVFLRPFVVRDEQTARALLVDRYDLMRTLEGDTRQSPHPVLPEMPNPRLPPLQQ